MKNLITKYKKKLSREMNKLNIKISFYKRYDEIRVLSEEQRNEWDEAVVEHNKRVFAYNILEDMKSDQTGL